LERTSLRSVESEEYCWTLDANADKGEADCGEAKSLEVAVLKSAILIFMI